MLPEHALKDRHLKDRLSERLSDVLCSGAWSPEKDSCIGNYHLPSKHQHEQILSSRFILSWPVWNRLLDSLLGKRTFSSLPIVFSYCDIDRRGNTDLKFQFNSLRKVGPLRLKIPFSAVEASSSHASWQSIKWYAFYQRGLKELALIQH